MAIFETDSRTKPSEQPKVSLRDQIVKKLFAKLEDQQTAQKVTKAWSAGLANIGDHLEKQKIYLQSVDSHTPVQEGAGPNPTNNNNLHLPMPFIVKRAYVARFMQALFGVDPPFSLKARRPDGIDKVPALEAFMRYVIYNWGNHNKGIVQAVEDWLDAWCGQGTGIAKVRWTKDTCSYEDVELVEEPAPPAVALDEAGNEVLVPQTRLVEKEVKKTRVKFDGPVVERVNREDFVMVGGEGDPDAADMVIHRYHLTESELWARADQKLFDKDAVELVVSGGDQVTAGGLGNEIKQMRAENSGKANIDEASTTLKRYEILEAYIKVDVDGTGVHSDVVAWVATNTNALLRATYLHRISPTGMKPFAVAHFSRRQGQEDGVGLLELLFPLANELDTLRGIKMDFAMANTLPTFFYKASSSIDPAVIQLEPGAGIPVDNPQSDVFFPPRPQSHGFYGTEMAEIMGFIEKLTGLSDLNFGSQATQGAARTASGVRALISESSLNLNLALGNINRAWTRILHLLYYMVAQRADGKIVFRVTGDRHSSQFAEISPYDFVDVDFELEANSASSNKAVAIETAAQLMAIASNPINLQLGVTTAASVYEANKNYLTSLGIQDYSRYITKPQGYEYMPSPEEIFNRAVRGMDVKPDPRQDVAGIIAFFQTMIDMQAKTPTLDEGQVRQAIAVLRQYQQLDSAMQQAEAQAQVAAQMRNNAAMSQNQAPTAMNPLEGSMPGQLPGADGA